MWAAQKKILSLAQIIGTKNVQYANCLTLLSFYDYIITHSMYQKADISGLVLFESISQRFSDLLTQPLRGQHLNRICKLYRPVQH